MSDASLPVTAAGELAVASPNKPLRTQKPRDPRRKVRPDFLSRRVREAIDRMVFYGEDRETAAKAVGLKDRSLRDAFLMHSVRRHFTEQMEVFRTSARPTALRQIAHLSTKAGSEKVQLDASKYLDGQDRNTGTSVVVNVGVAVAPGYLVDVGAGHDEAEQIARLAGSTRSILDNKSEPAD